MGEGVRGALSPSHCVFEDTFSSLVGGGVGRPNLRPSEGLYLRLTEALLALLSEGSMAGGRRPNAKAKNPR